MPKAEHIDLSCQNLCKHFDSFTAVDNVSFTIPQGSFFSILGPSGCGKTTLLRMLAGFEPPSSGDIQIRGQSVLAVPPNKRPVNMVFQHLALFPNMTVAENIAYGLKRQKVPAGERTKRVQAVLERVGLPDSGSKQIEQLSGGQRQRIALARCLVLNPTLLLLDEPLGALDLKLREHMKVELKQLQKEFGTTFVYITHDQSEALVMSDHVAVMNHGKFEQIGTPQALYYQPETAFVASFIGDSNHWQGQVKNTADGRIVVTSNHGLELVATAHDGSQINTGNEVSIFIRPEAIDVSRQQRPSNGDNALNCTVEPILFDGAKSQIIAKEIQSADQITVTLPQTTAFSDLKQGDPLYLSWAASQTLCFKAPHHGTNGS